MAPVTGLVTGTSPKAKPKVGEIEMRGGEAGRQGAGWHKVVTFTLDDFLALKGLTLYTHLCYQT